MEPNHSTALRASGATSNARNVHATASTPAPIPALAAGPATAIARSSRGVSGSDVIVAMPPSTQSRMSVTCTPRRRATTECASS
mgnify:CR=1 FL=1